jgi:lipopolysaccharide biosynthesis protein
MSLLYLLRSVLRMVVKGFQAVLDRVSWCSSILRSRAPRIRRRWDGERSLETARKIAILVHFTRDGRFLAYFRYLTRALDRAGFAVIIVSNSRTLDSAEVAELLPYSAAIIHRHNVGYDFGAWRDGLSLVAEPRKLDRLILTNDSIFGPLHDLGAVVDRCNHEQADVWGITDCYSGRYHLQSYFLVFHKRALESNEFAKFWKNMRYVENKRVVIFKYEIGLSQALLRAGLRLHALYPYAQLVEQTVFREALPQSSEILANSTAVVAEAEGMQGAMDKLKITMGAEYYARLLKGVNAGTPLNPTHFFWEHLVTVAGCPFIKRDLIEKNPVSVPLLANWRRAIGSTSSYPIDMIDEYLQVATRNRVF